MPDWIEALAQQPPSVRNIFRLPQKVVLRGTTGTTGKTVKPWFLPAVEMSSAAFSICCSTMMC